MLEFKVGDKVRVKENGVKAYAAAGSPLRDTAGTVAQVHDYEYITYPYDVVIGGKTLLFARDEVEAADV